MSESIYLPKPVALVAENMTALQNAITHRRRLQGVEPSFVGALGDVLGSDSQQIVVEVIAGTSAHFSFFDGPAFGRGIRDQFESHYQVIGEYQRRLDRRSSLDIVDLAEDLATDPALSGLYADSVRRRDEVRADEVVGEAARVLMAKVNAASARVGQRVRLDQAAAVVQRLGEKAAVALRSGNEAALLQAQWCVALLDALSKEKRA